MTSRDLTIDTALGDPLIRAVMKADRVDPNDLAALLRGAARRLEAKPDRAVPAQDGAFLKGRGIFPCLCAA